MRSIILFILIIISFSVNAQQNPKKFIREGNKLYEQKKYNDAEVQYRKSLAQDSTYVAGQYNLANSLYKQKNYDEANKIYSALAERETNSLTKSKILHNLGNTYLQKKEYEKSIDAYKQAMRNNPKDEETRYNLAYAKKMLKQQQQLQQQNKNGKDNKDSKDKKDKQNKDGKQNKQDQNKDKQQQDQKQGDDQNKKQDQQQKQKMKKEDAERMLEALKNNEKKTMDKVKKEKNAAVKIKLEKDW